MVSSSHKLESNEAKQILVQLNDGSTWKAEMEAGELVLIEQLTDPTHPPTPPEEATASEPAPEPEESEMDSEAPEQSEADTQDETQAEEDSEQDSNPYDEMFKQEYLPVPNKSLEDMFKKTPNINGMPDELKAKLKDPAFRARLSSIMLDNKYDRKLRGRTRGKLDMGRLPKVPMMNRNIFVQKQSRRGKNYNVIILVDQSGSMDGAKSDEAAETAMFLLNAFDGININTSIIGFHDEIHIYKDWGSKKQYDTIYKDLLGNYGGNEDYDAMHFALEQFKRAPEGENILLMLSDGYPTLSGYGDAYDEKDKRIKFAFHPEDMHGEDLKYDDWKNDKEYLHHLVNSYPNVKAVGIGIFEGGWQIPEHFIIHNLNDLRSTIIKVLGKKIQRG